MTTTDLLNLDCRESANVEKLQKALHKMKPFKKYEKEVPQSVLEKFIRVATRKYKMHIKEFYPDTVGGDDYIIWRTIAINDKDLSELAVIYGVSLYEVLAKICIAFYVMIKSEKIERR